MRHLALILVSLALPPLSLRGQTLIQGRIIDNTTLAPLSGVDVQVLNPRLQRVERRTTDEDGFFGFTSDREGGYRFRASRMGYQQTTTPVVWTDGRDYIQVEIRLDPEAVLLAPIEITARSPARRSPTLSGFRHRSESGFGHYFTRHDIEQLEPVYVSDVIGTVAGVRLVSTGRGNRRLIYLSRSRGVVGACPAQLFVDGILINRPSPLTGQEPPFSIDDIVSPGDIEGIEIYKGPSTIPAEFLGPNGHCGAILIWTRRGGGSTTSRP